MRSHTRSSKVAEASFDEPWHWQEPFTPNDIDIGLGMQISGDRFWDGTQLISREQYMDLIHLYEVSEHPDVVAKHAEFMGKTPAEYLAWMEKGRSKLVTVQTSVWGDSAGLFVDGAWEPADGAVNITDALACVEAFGGLPTIPLEWCDVDPEIPNGQIDIIDILRIIEAFGGLPYPHAIPCK